MDRCTTPAWFVTSIYPQDVLAPSPASLPRIRSQTGESPDNRGGCPNCPPLNFKIFISSNAFDNSSFFNQQPKFARLVCVVIAAQICSEIDTASRYPIPLYDTLISCVFSVRPFCNVYERICHFSLLFFTTGVNEHNHNCESDGTVGSITLAVDKQLFNLSLWLWNFAEFGALDIYAVTCRRKSPPRGA